MKRLKELRTSKRLSQQALADMIHVTQQSIHKYETGLAEPELDIIIACAKIFDTSVDYLIGYTDIPERYEYMSQKECAITSSEKRLLCYYRKLSQNAQDHIQGLISELY